MSAADRDCGRLSPAQALAALAEAGGTYTTLFRHGTLEVEIYRPVGSDPQQPHERDEIYVVISGTGRFSCAGESRPFAPGDVLFVAAGVEHRFTEFSSDFATWVFFWGPRGGEAASGPGGD